MSLTLLDGEKAGKVHRSGFQVLFHKQGSIHAHARKANNKIRHNSGNGVLQKSQRIDKARHIQDNRFRFGIQILSG